jgi:hypothetical protein
MRTPPNPVLTAHTVVNSICFMVESSARRGGERKLTPIGLWGLRRHSTVFLIDFFNYFAYLTSHEYYLHFMYIIKGLGISISTCLECLIYNKTLLIKPASHPITSCKDCPDFSHQPDSNHIKDIN